MNQGKKIYLYFAMFGRNIHYKVNEMSSNDHTYRKITDAQNFEIAGGMFPNYKKSVGH